MKVVWVLVRLPLRLAVPVAQLKALEREPQWLLTKLQQHYEPPLLVALC